MTEQVSQPPCGFFGSLVRADRITQISRDITPLLADAEAHTAKMTGDPALALKTLAARRLDVEYLRAFEMIGDHEFAVRVAGDCLGDAVTEGDALVADPARAIPSGALALIRVRGDSMMRGKIYLGRMTGVGNPSEIFTATPDGVFVFWNHHPAHLLCCAGQDLIGADLVVAKIDQTGTRIDLSAEFLTADDRARLEETLAFIDATPLVIEGDSAFKIDQQMLAGFADKVQTASPGSPGQTASERGG